MKNALTKIWPRASAGALDGEITAPGCAHVSTALFGEASEMGVLAHFGSDSLINGGQQVSNFLGSSSAPLQDVLDILDRLERAELITLRTKTFGDGLYQARELFGNSVLALAERALLAATGVAARPVSKNSAITLAQLKNWHQSFVDQGYRVPPAVQTGNGAFVGYNDLFHQWVLQSYDQDATLQMWETYIMLTPTGKRVAKAMAPAFEALRRNTPAPAEMRGERQGRTSLDSIRTGPVINI